MDISERKQAHEQIAQAAQKWTTTFDSIQDGILLLSADQTVQQANQAFADLVKKPFAAIIGKKCYELVHADRQPDPNCPFARSSKSKKRDFMELEINGRIFKIVTDPLKRNSGAFSGAVHIMTDITELKRVEQTLRASEQRLRRFYESGMLGVIYWNMDGLIMDANDKFLELVGYTRDDLKRGKIDWIHMTPPEYQHLDKNSVKELKATGVNKKPFEKEYIRKNGTRIPILLAGAMLDEDRFNGVAFVLDITERKKAEEDILKLSAVVEQSTEGMAIAGLDGILSFVNEAWCKMHDYISAKELIGKNLAIFHNQEQIENEVKPFNEKVNELGAYSGEVGHITRDGKPFPTLMTSTLLKDKQGKPYALAGIARDITERKRAEEQILASLREKEVLLKEIHHRVKNNLQVISGLLTLQAGQINDERLQGLLKESQSRIWTMALIHQTLYQSGNLAAIDMADYIRTLSGNLLSSQARVAMPPTVNFDLAPLLLAIEKAIPLALIINELLTNCLKHAFADGRPGEIRISLHAVGTGVRVPA